MTAAYCIRSRTVKFFLAYSAFIKDLGIPHISSKEKEIICFKYLDWLTGMQCFSSCLPLDDLLKCHSFAPIKMPKRNCEKPIIKCIRENEKLLLNSL